MFDSENDFHSERKKLENMPIYKKGKEINDVVRQISSLIPEDDKELLTQIQFAIADASQLTVKIAGAEGGDLYDIRMECAAIIRKAARDLYVSYHSFKMYGFDHAEYFQIIRKLIDEYQLLFIDWVAGFNKSNYIIDRWGLFNPPGVGPFDKDLDDFEVDPENFFDSDDDDN